MTVNDLPATNNYPHALYRAVESIYPGKEYGRALRDFDDRLFVKVDGCLLEFEIVDSKVQYIGLRNADSVEMESLPRTYKPIEVQRPENFDIIPDLDMPTIEPNLDLPDLDPTAPIPEPEVAAVEPVEDVEGIEAVSSSSTPEPTASYSSEPTTPEPAASSSSSEPDYAAPEESVVPYNPEPLELNDISNIGNVDPDIPIYFPQATREVLSKYVATLEPDDKKKLIEELQNMDNILGVSVTADGGLRGTKLIGTEATVFFFEP